VTKPLSTPSAKLAMVILAMSLVPAIAPTAALSADMDPIYVDEQVVTPVEYGSGWYLRGDVGYSFHGPFDEGDNGDFDFTPVNASVAMGYQFTDYLRGELEFGYLGSSSYESSHLSICDGTRTITTPLGVVVSSGPASIACEGSNSFENEMWNGLVNGYVDLGQYGGFKPYVGAGLGVVYSSYSADIDDRHCENETVTGPGGTDAFTCDEDQSGSSYDDKSYGLLWQLSAGFGYQLSEFTTLDVGYRYLSSPHVQHIAGDTAEVKEGMSVQQLRVGLRYAIW
jgi:opacity protein-like surface antigen